MARRAPADKDTQPWRTPNHGDIDHVKLNQIFRGAPSTDTAITPPPLLELTF